MPFVAVAALLVVTVVLDLWAAPGWPVAPLYAIPVLLVPRRRRPTILPTASVVSLLILVGSSFPEPASGRDAVEAAVALVVVWAVAFRRSGEGPAAGPDAETARSYLDVAEVAVVALDRDGRVRLVNRKGCEILGREPDEIFGEDWFATFVPERVRAEVRRVFDRVMGGREEAPRVFENPVLNAAGEERIIAWHNTVLEEDGRIVGTLSSGEDITERKLSEDAFRRTHRELEDMQFALDQAAIVASTDQKGVIRFVNDKFCEISGYTREELLGRDHRIINSGHHPEEFIRDLWQTIGRGEVWRGEIRNRAKDGRLYWVDTTIVPFLDERGKPYKYLAIRSDVTDRKAAEEALRKQEGLARIGQMAAVVAHEVKNPLAGISGALQVIRNRLPEDATEREVLASILQRIEDLNGRVRDLLLFARPRPPRFSPVDLTLLLRTTADFIARDPALKDVAVEVVGERVSLQADPDLLKDVFLNLYLNAAQAMNGGGRVAVAIEQGDGACRVTVRDEGPGIDPDARDHVFEPFFTTKSRGTGLGLAIARRVVEAHRGSIRLACPDGGGTEIAVSMPLRQEAAIAAGGGPDDGG